MADPTTEKDERFCDACGIAERYAYRGLDEYDKFQPRTAEGEKKTKTLCHLCASTMSGNTVDFSDQFPGKSGSILQAICFVGNLLLAERRGE